MHMGPVCVHSWSICLLVGLSEWPQSCLTVLHLVCLHCCDAYVGHCVWSQSCVHPSFCLSTVQLQLFWLFVGRSAWPQSSVILFCLSAVSFTHFVGLLIWPHPVCLNPLFCLSTVQLWPFGPCCIKLKVASLAAFHFILSWNQSDLHKITDIHIERAFF